MTVTFCCEIKFIDIFYIITIENSCFYIFDYYFLKSITILIKFRSHTAAFRNPVDQNALMFIKQSSLVIKC